MVEQNKNRKFYVLDTNVIVHDPYAYKNFEGVFVGIPAIVLEELDTFKREGTDRGRNAREFIRELDALRSMGSLKEGVTLSNGATVRVLFIGSDFSDMPFHMEEQDNRILLSALELVKEGYQVKLISKDLNVRVKADALGIASEDYLKEHVSEEEFYKGWMSIDVSSGDLTSAEPSILKKVSQEYDLALNEFVLLRSQNNPHNNRIFRYIGGDRFLPIYAPKLKWPLEPRNVQQIMALNLLLDDSIPFVTLLGPAGTGKTFLALLAGLHKTLVKDDFRKLLVSRPVVPLGRDLGYLPGTLEEKLHSWMLPIYDNMEFIMHSINL
ncbi:MAG TPA: PIN domain-containing protein, partial [Candidatus Babeliales bacterium]|nr:PIN domain-containing protein [Candidatus Babeliales bacterium]